MSIRDREKRYEHFLRPIKDKMRPQYYLCVEPVATQLMIGRSYADWNDRLLCWHAVGGWEGDEKRPEIFHYYGKTADDFAAMLTTHAKHGRTIWVFMLPASRGLALLGFWDRLERGEYYLAGDEPRQVVGDERDSKSRKTGYCVLADPPTVILLRIKDYPGMIKIIDVRNYGVDGWDVIADSIDCNVDFIRNQYPSLSEANWWGETRASVLHEFMSTFTSSIASAGLGSLKNTIGSQALSGFKRSYLKSTIFVHNHPQALKLEESALYGGRCEVYQMGDVVGPVYHWDFTAMYPSVCVREPMPLLLCGYKRNPAPAEMFKISTEYLPIADVKLTTSRPEYPKKMKGTTVYPVGTFSTVLCGPELLHAYACGRVRECRAVAWYDGNDCFTEYMTTLYALRAEFKRVGNRAGVEAFKRLMAALPGKFAQRDKCWVDCPHKIATHPYCIWYEYDNESGNSEYRSVAWNVQREQDNGVGKESCPAITAWITSLGRSKLLNAIVTAGWDNVYYVDTDSLFTNQEGRDRLLRSPMGEIGGMGSLRLVNIYDTTTFCGIKWYSCDGVLKCSGAAKGWEEPGIFDEERFRYETPTMAMLARRQPGSAKRVVGIERDMNYRHGVVEEDGTVSPITLKERI